MTSRVFLYREVFKITLKPSADGFFLVNDMQTPSSLPKNIHFHFLVQKFAQCSETNEKSILRFLVFWDMRAQNSWIFWRRKNSSQKMRYVLKRICQFLSFSEIFSFWDIIDFVLDIRSELVWVLDEFIKIIAQGVSTPTKPGFTGLPPTPPGFMRSGKVRIWGSRSQDKQQFW